MATERIDIVVTERGAREVNRSITQIGASAAGAAPGVTRLQGAISGLIASVVSLTAVIVSGGAILDFANSFVQLQNRVRTVTNSIGVLNVVTDELFEIANRTRASVEGTAELFVRTSLAVRDLGRAQSETLQFTESLNKTIILSGASANEALAGMIQLSQGLASGTLRGDELRSVLEQLPAVADVIAQHMGITRGELRRLGFEGKITAEIILDAFREAREEIAERFERTILTLPQSLVILRNQAIRFFGELDRGIGVTRAFSDLVKLIGDDIETLARVALAALISGVIFLARVAIPLLIRQVTALFTLIARHPIGLLLTAIVAGASALAAWSDEIVVFQENSVTLADVAGATFEVVGEEIARAAENMGENLLALWNMAAEAFGGIEQAGAAAAEATRRSWFQNLLLIAEAFDRFVNQFVQIHFALAARLAGQTEEQARQTAINIQTLLFGGVVDVSGAIERIQVRATERARARADEALRLAAEQEEALRRLQELGERRVGAPRDDSDFDRAEFMARVNREIEQQNILLGLNTREREVQAQIMDISNTLLDNGSQLYDEERVRLEASIRLLQERARVTEELDAITDDLTQRQEQLITRIRLLEQLSARGGPMVRQFTQMLAEANMELLELRIQTGEGGFADAFILGLLRMTEAARNWRATVGTEFANFFDSIADGAARAFSRAIVYGEDLGEALLNVAREAVAELLTSLIKLGIQWVINATIGAAAQEAAAAASIATAASVAAAWSAAATAVTLASYGANVPVAIAGMASAYAAGAAMSAAASAVPGFRDGGLFLGPGGPRQDAGLARLSRGEFVVNADSTRRNLALLRAINENSSAGLSGARGGDTYVTNHTTINVQDADPRRAEEAGRAAAREFERGVEQVMRKQKRPGGLLVRGSGNTIAG